MTAILLTVLAILVALYACLWDEAEDDQDHMKIDEYFTMTWWRFGIARWGSWRNHGRTRLILADSQWLLFHGRLYWRARKAPC